MLSTKKLLVGDRVTFRSPLFGMVQADVVGLELTHIIIDRHSVIGQMDPPARIPLEWVVEGG